MDSEKPDVSMDLSALQFMDWHKWLLFRHIEEEAFKLVKDQGRSLVTVTDITEVLHRHVPELVLQLQIWFTPEQWQYRLREPDNELIEKMYAVLESLRVGKDTPFVNPDGATRRWVYAWEVTPKESLHKIVQLFEEQAGLECRFELASDVAKKLQAQSIW